MHERMTSHYTIDSTRRAVRLMGTIPAALEDWCATLDAVFADPAYAPGYNFLSDRRGTRVPPPDAYVLDGVQYLQAHRSQFQGCRWALVIDSEALGAWGRVVTILGESAGIRIAVFGELDDAWRWTTGKEGAAGER
jgi:hypothetical protein